MRQKGKAKKEKQDRKWQTTNIKRTRKIMVKRREKASR